MLGLVVLVAVYFWVPLVWRWVGKGSAETATAKATTTSAAAMTVATRVSEGNEAGQPAAKQNTSRLPWQQIVQLRKNDPKTMPAPPLATTRDPFVATAPQVAATKKLSEAAKKPITPVIAPSAVGLALKSTVIGPQRRVAQINGRVYAVGQTVSIKKDSQDISFKVIDVQPRGVVLEAQGQRFELTIPEPGRSQKIEAIGVAEHR